MGQNTQDYQVSIFKVCDREAKQKFYLKKFDMNMRALVS